MKKYLGAALSGAAFVALSAAPGLAQDKEPLKIGVTATLEGTYTVLGEDGMRGFEVALQERNKMAGGRPLEIVVASTDASPDSAIRAVRKLVEQDKVDLVISPLSGDEGIAVKNYAKTQPDMTFINAASGAQETTFVDPSENFFRYNMDGAQWSAGLGDYIFNEKGWKKIATIGEDYSFVYTQVFGLLVEYCSAGGEVSERFWVPLGTKDFSSIIAALPDDVDAIYLGLGGGDAVNFLNQYAQAGGDAHFLGGSIMVDQTVLSSKGRAKELLKGTPAASGQADTWDNPKWQAFVKAYQDAFPPEKRFAGPSLLATNYYNAAIAAFNAIDELDGDISDQAKLRETLQNMVLDAPNGEIKLDENRQAIGTNFVTEVVEDSDGNLVSKVVKVVPDVNQTLGLPLDEFKKIGLPSRDVPECKKYK